MCPIPMKQLFRLLTLLFFLIHLKSEAQTDIQQDWRVDSLLKQVGAKRPGLMMFGRKAGNDKYVNMSVLNDSTRTLTWFTCYGQVFDAVKLTDDAFNGIKSGTLDPFDYYKDYSVNQFSLVRLAATVFRQKGETALKDTGSIYYKVYTYPTVQQAQSTLQKEVAMEKSMSDLSLQLSLFNTRTPRRLTPNDSFQARLRLAGRMIRKGDTTVYYNTNPLSAAARIVLNKQTPGKMFIYGREGQLADSVPLKSGKYAALLIEKEDVFLLYRGWLELQSQQTIAGKEEVTRLLNREYAMLYKPAYWKANKQQLEQTLLEVRQRLDAIGDKVTGLIVPPLKEVEHLLAAIYPDKPAEISYLTGLGFAYTTAYNRGNKQYELANHLGNVIAVVSDRKKGVDENGNGSVAYYNADVVSAVDYLPFGGQMPERTYHGEDKYRYGFNGKENDNEIKGAGNQQDYGMRIYDPRLGRFLSTDPITAKYPMLTPYQFASNTPIQAIDRDGLEEYHFRLTLDKQGRTHLQLIGKPKYYNEHSWLGGLIKIKDKILTERAVVSYNNEDYYIGFHGTQGTGNSDAMYLFKLWKAKPDAQTFPYLFYSEFQSNMGASLEAVERTRDNLVTALYTQLIAAPMAYPLKGKDMDWRGTGKNYKDALEEAFKKTGVDKEEFEVTKWGKDKYGKSVPVEYRSKGGAEVNMDYPHNNNGQSPDVPHVGWQTPGKRGTGGAERGHIMVDEVPAGRSNVKE